MQRALLKGDKARLGAEEQTYFLVFNQLSSSLREGLLQKSPHLQEARVKKWV
jgi:hypothetical protein